jgi:hypothetical protein
MFYNLFTVIVGQCAGLQGETEPSQALALSGLQFKVRLLKWRMVTNTLAYYGMELTAAI